MPTKTNKSTSKKVEKITCNVCGKEQAGGNYYTSDREEFSYLGGKAPFCKKCLNAMIVDVNAGKITIDKFKAVMKILDYPFVNSLYIEVVNNENTNNSNMLGRYIKAINLKPEFKNTGYSDTVRFEIQEQQIMNSKIEEDKQEEVTKDMINFWGHGKKNEDYIELQSMYDRFMENEEDDVIDYKKQSDYKTLCELEMLKRAMILNGEKVGDLAKVVDMISKLSADLNIKAIQKKEDNSNKGAYDLFIKKIEQTRPVFDFERDLGNKDEVKELLQLYFYAYLMDVNNQRTQFTDELYNELGQYTPNTGDLAHEYTDEDDD